MQGLLAVTFPSDKESQDPDQRKADLVSSLRSSALDTSEVDKILYDSLWEVRSLQNSLLQANNDAMRLSGRILQTLQTLPSSAISHV